MRKLSEFKDDESIIIVGRIIPHLFGIFGNPKNAELADESNPFKMFSKFFENSPEEIKNIMAVLSETDPKEYHCDGIDVAQNLIAMATDEKLLSLFYSQEQTGDATSSVPATENTTE